MTTFYGVCFPTGESTGYVVGENGLILKTTDGGGTVPGWRTGRPGDEPDRNPVRVQSDRHGVASTPTQTSRHRV